MIEPREDVRDILDKRHARFSRLFWRVWGLWRRSINRARDQHWRDYIVAVEQLEARNEAWRERDELLALLRDVEWEAETYHDEDSYAACPVCLNKKVRGHNPNCRLAAAERDGRKVPRGAALALARF